MIRKNFLFRLFEVASMILFVIMLQLSVSSCSMDDAITDAQKENTNKDGEEKSDGETVVINDDGTTSNGAKYVAIDQNNFYLDDIKYSVADDHLAVSGHSEEFNGNAKIYANITFKGTSYDVLEIGENAFSSILTKLTSITIPNSVTSIGESAFFCCGLTNITLPKSLENIGSFAFMNNDITSITIPNSVISVGECIWLGNYNLTSVNVEEGNPKYDSRDNCNALIETASNTLIAACENTFIPNSVTSIGTRAFCFLAHLTSIVIPNSVTSIGDGAFLSCLSLTNITIPNSVTSIGNGAFSNCGNLTSVTIPDSVTSIGNGAFSNCGNLTSVTIPESVTSIDNSAFASSGLTSVSIPESVTSIGQYAFNWCGNLTSVTIGNSVTNIGSGAFAYCSRLEKVKCMSVTPPQIYNDTFSDIDNAAKLFVPMGAENTYRNADVWKDAFHEIVGE